MRIMTSTNLMAAILCFLALIFNMMLKPVIDNNSSENHETTELNQGLSFKVETKKINSLPGDPLIEGVKMTASKSLC